MNTVLLILLCVLGVYSLIKIAEELHKKKAREMDKIKKDLQIALIRAYGRKTR